VSNASGRIAILDLSHEEQNELDELIVQWRAKRRRNALRAGFYDMKNATRKLMASAAPMSIKQRAFALGWSASAVDKLNRRCNLDGFYNKGGVNLDSLGLGEIVSDNRLLSEVSQAGVSSLIHSVSWLITTQGDTQAGEPDVLITARDALTGTGIWDSRRRMLRSFVSLTDFNSGGEPTAMTMYLNNVNVEMTKTDGRWTVVRRPHIYGVPVDPMRYKPRLGRPFGSSRITRTVMSIHEQALAAMIRADVNGEAYSLARYVLLGATESAFQNADGSPKPTWQAAWDAVWAIGDDEDAASPALARADVKQFTGQSPEPQNAHLRMLAQMFSGETSIPIGELGIIGDSNPTSYEAMSASRDDIIATAETTTDDWSPDVESAAARALAMRNKGDVPDDLKVTARWRPHQYASRAAAADAGTKIIDKMPWLSETEVGMEVMGLTRDQIDRALSERQRAEGRAVLSRLVGRDGNDVA
jgi:hypothetical protein